MRPISFAAIAAFCVLAVSAPALAESFKGTCTVSAGAISAKRYAVLKCYRHSDPGNYLIRSTRWERDDAAAYRDLARLSGRRFSCDFSLSGSSSKDDTLFTHYSLKNCR